MHVERWRTLVEELGWETHLLWYEGPPAGAGALGTLSAVLRGRAAVRQALRSVKPDLVHAHWLVGPAWAAALAGARPLVVSAWGSDALVWTPASRLARVLARLVARRAAAATYDADAVADALERNGFERAQLVRVVFGADTERFRPQPRDDGLLVRLGAAVGGPVVLAPRGVAPVYHPETIVEAVARLERPVTLLLRAPEGELRDAIRALAERLGVAEVVVPYNDVPPDDLPALLASVDVVVSVPESDGTSVLLLETLLSGTPVIASDLPANREWLDAVVPVGDAAALAEALERVLADPQAARSAAAQAAERVRGRGSRAVQREAIRVLYEKWAGARPTHTAPLEHET